LVDVFGLLNLDFEAMSLLTLCYIAAFVILLFYGVREHLITPKHVESLTSVTERIIETKSLYPKSRDQQAKEQLKRQKALMERYESIKGGT
jgi:hypothetical protein